MNIIDAPDEGNCLPRSFQTKIALLSSVLLGLAATGCSTTSAGEPTRSDNQKPIVIDNGQPWYFTRRDLAKLSKQYERDASLYTELIKKDPSRQLNYMRRGDAYFGLHQYEKAITDYSKVIEFHPKSRLSHNPAYLNRGAAYAYSKQFSKAIPDFNNAIQLDPTDYEAVANRATAYEETGDKAKALVDRRSEKSLRDKFGPFADASPSTR